jgi:hypothetical protein
MAESQLTQAFYDLQGEIGMFLGWGRGTQFGDPAWDARKQAAIDSATKKGLRRFYFSALIPGQDALHNWSFLRPTAAIDLPAEQNLVNMPDDFAGWEDEPGVQLLADFEAGNMVFQRRQLQDVGIMNVRRRYSELPAATGVPSDFAITPIKGTTATSGQRYEMTVFPVADQEYMIVGEYYILPDYLSGALPFCYGGAAHSGTVLEACICACERDMDNARSVHEAHYQDLLAASISFDRNLKQQFLGTNRDFSDERNRMKRRSGYEGQYASFDGVFYP